MPPRKLRGLWHSAQWPETVDEIGAAIPRRRMRGVRRERLAVHEQPFPDADIAADVEWKRHVVIARLARHRRQRLQVGKEIADVLDLRMLVGRVGKGREIMLAVRRGPLEHRGDEIGLAPAADAVRSDRARCWGRRTSRTATGSQARRPASSRSGWLGTAWQEEQPPALNVVRPLARFGVRAGSEAGATTAGIVSHQKMPTPTSAGQNRDQAKKNSSQHLADPSDDQRGAV